MLLQNWLNLVLAISFGITFFLLFRLYLKKRNLLELYFSLSAAAVAFPYTYGLFFDIHPSLLEWGRLVAITFYISGLLVLIRESKPPFARFPIYLTALPFVSFLFFPLIIDSLAIKNLINGIYQGGALIVTLLIFTVNNVKTKGRRYYLLGLGLVTIAYLGFWGSTFLDYEGYAWSIKIILSTGILITVFKFIQNR
jgi:uncharacterized membrane protein